MSGGLFDDQLLPASAPASPRDGPLAERMRPRTLEEIVGQDEVTGERGFLRGALLADRAPSLIFWGPPGSGKTTLARLIATSTRAEFVPFSAVTSGIKEIKELMARAARARQASGRRTLLFVDEIHRFNRAQQDAFLPYVERGDIVLVGATTENPSFELNAALLSRCRVVVLRPLGETDIVALLRRALDDAERGLGGLGVAASDDALVAIARWAEGDARRALGLLETTHEDGRSRGVSGLTPEDVERVAQQRVLLYDKSGEEHYNLISALHKSMRDSDADAALYWLERMLASGEDAGFLARRMVRFASEDVGLADPQALVQAMTAWSAYDRLGSPEGDLALAQAVVYLSLAPKSNALYKAEGAVRQVLREAPAEPVPLALRNAPTRLMGELGYGRGYVYAHDTQEGTGGLDCLPDALSGRRFYEPSGQGFEERLVKRLEDLRQRRAAARARRSSGAAGEGP
jgi:putative ATPase